MARYVLPAELGGGEVEATNESYSGLPHLVAFDVDDRVVVVHRELLTSVKPPLPPEPPVGSIVRCDEGYIHIRQSGRGWTGHDADRFTSWPLICRDCDGAVPLVPDPLVGAPELPWRSDGGGLEVVVSEFNGGVYIEDRDGGHTTVVGPRYLREMGLALLRAAAEQEANS